MQDPQRAKSFYAEKLGLEPSEETPGGQLYSRGDGEFFNKLTPTRKLGE